MATDDVVASIQDCIKALEAKGLPVRFAVLYGSFARGDEREWSDIDLVVVSPVFDGQAKNEDINLLWRVAGRTDTRIEPIPCGERQWVDDTSRAIIEIARREGTQILPAVQSSTMARPPD